MWRCGDREGDIFITDENGNPVRYPIRLSEFQERPRFHLAQSIEKEQQIVSPIIEEFQLIQWARDVNRLIERNKRRKKEPAMKYKVKNKNRGIS